MNSICVLTDSIIQFPSPIFEGRELIYYIDLNLVTSENSIISPEELRSFEFPSNLFNKEDSKHTPQLKTPSLDIVSKKIEQLNQKYDTVICLTSSQKLTPFYDACKQAIEIAGLQSNTHLIDSNSFALGQGILCQLLVDQILQKKPVHAILQSIRQETKNIYAIFYIQNFSYLYRSNLLPHSSALLAEINKTKQTFILEKGSIFPSEKAKSLKNIVDIFESYACEFEDIQNMSILQSKPALSKLTQQYKERLEISNPNLSSEQIISPQVASIIGPQTTGIFFYEPLLF